MADLNPATAEQPGRGAPKGNSNARKHGLNSLKRAWSQLGNRALDGRSPAAVAIRRWRADLIEDLGGADVISTQQLAIIDLAGKQKLLLDSIDTWLLSQPSLINHRKRSVIPVVLQRQALADGLSKYLAQLGLERRHKVKPCMKYSLPITITARGKNEKTALHVEVRTHDRSSLRDLLRVL